MGAQGDARAGKYTRLINEADDASETFVLTTGSAASDGGTLVNVGSAGNWYAAVWASVDAASSSATPLIESTVTVPASGTIKVAEDAADVTSLGDGTYWWALIQLSPRKTYLAGPYRVAAGWAGA